MTEAAAARTQIAVFPVPHFAERARTQYSEELNAARRSCATLSSVATFSAGFCPAEYVGESAAPGEISGRMNLRELPFISIPHC